MELKSTVQKSDGLKRKPTGAAVMRTDITETLFKSLFEEWAQCGYSSISLERVAARAGCGKAAIYRRWPSKLSFASDAIKAASFVLTDITDHGSLEADLTAYLLMMRRALRHKKVRLIFADLVAERSRAGELLPIVEELSTFRRGKGEELLDRAIKRGELPGKIDIELAMDMIPSPLYWRMVVLGQHVSKTTIIKQVQMLIAAISCEMK
ncbi:MULTISPECIES: TetR/AcrR family transcriptional regulator [unclassified Pseudovibrio]|uniref:TetR/AcrR family transcriptional regulator n=1 Tax=unclassified Pseudovibrio TaxID=2627060 RepID=UPI0007AEBC78|nr:MULTISPECIES: TetR/AcrR family transcriptional regulator [unclassified Pseudovibrio]KZK98004.1 Bacterial regulatory protein, tetR family [Pseudovibrio sp. W74]KZL05310.1 Bacterial regulatory protein, tetR family [Pseudovibrio sp. Ad14]